MIRTYKEQFANTPARLAWEKIVNEPTFEVVCNYALLHYQDQMPVAADLAYGAHMQMVGAQALVRILKTIHETTKETKEPTRQGLNYQAGV